MMQDMIFNNRFEQALKLIESGEYALAKNNLEVLSIEATTINDIKFDLQQLRDFRRARCQIAIAYCLLYQGEYTYAQVKFQNYASAKIEIEWVTYGLILCAIFKEDIAKAKDLNKNFSSSNHKIFQRYFLLLDGKADVLNITETNLMQDPTFYFNLKLKLLAEENLGKLSLPAEVQTVADWTSTLCDNKHLTLLSTLSFLVSSYYLSKGNPNEAKKYIMFAKEKNRSFQPIILLEKDGFRYQKDATTFMRVSPSSSSIPQTSQYRFLSSSPRLESSSSSTVISSTQQLKQILVCKGLINSNQDFIAKFIDSANTSITKFCFIFPGNNRHNEDLLLHSHGGSHLADVAKKLIKIQVSAIGLPTKNYLLFNIQKSVTYDLAEQALAMLWYAVGLGLQIVLPIRDRVPTSPITNIELTTLHSSGLINLTDEPSFLGGSKPALLEHEKCFTQVNGRNISLLEFYFNQIAELYKFIKDWNAADDAKQNILQDNLHPLFKFAFKHARENQLCSDNKDMSAVKLFKLYNSQSSNYLRFS